MIHSIDDDTSESGTGISGSSSVGSLDTFSNIESPTSVTKNILYSVCSSTISTSDLNTIDMSHMNSNDTNDNSTADMSPSNKNLGSSSGIFGNLDNSDDEENCDDPGQNVSTYCDEDSNNSSNSSSSNSSSSSSNDDRTLMLLHRPRGVRFVPTTASPFQNLARHFAERTLGGAPESLHNTLLTNKSPVVDSLFSISSAADDDSSDSQMSTKSSENEAEEEEKSFKDSFDSSTSVKVTDDIIATDTKENEDSDSLIQDSIEMKSSVDEITITDSDNVSSLDQPISVTSPVPSSMATLSVLSSITYPKPTIAPISPTNLGTESIVRCVSEPIIIKTDTEEASEDRIEADQQIRVFTPLEIMQTLPILNQQDLNQSSVSLKVNNKERGTISCKNITSIASHSSSTSVSSTKLNKSVTIYQYSPSNKIPPADVGNKFIDGDRVQSPRNVFIPLVSLPADTTLIPCSARSVSISSGVPHSTISRVSARNASSCASVSVSVPLTVTSVSMLSQISGKGKCASADNRDETDSNTTPEPEIFSTAMVSKLIHGSSSISSSESKLDADKHDSCVATSSSSPKPNNNNTNITTPPSNTACISPSSYPICTTPSNSDMVSNIHITIVRASVVPTYILPCRYSIFSDGFLTCMKYLCYILLLFIIHKDSFIFVKVPTTLLKYSCIFYSHT